MSYFEERLAEIKAEQAARQPMIDARQKEEVRQIRRTEKKDRSGYVYFFRNGNEVKIGFTSNPQSRQVALRTASAGKAFMARYVEGNMAAERAFHKRFAEYHLRGEWFDLRGRLAKYLERHIHPVQPPQRIPIPEPEEVIIDL